MSRSKLTIDEIRTRARILVIDDESFPYLSAFQKEGYNITYWPDVTSLNDLEGNTFDLVLLDLQGVGRELSDQQGLGVLQHIREVSPAQLVLAYSAASYPLADHEFFNLADRILDKGATSFLLFRRTVDELLEMRFREGFYVARLEQELKRSGAREPSNWQRFRLQRALKRSRHEPVARISTMLGADQKTIDRALQIVQAAAAVAALAGN